MTSRSTEAKESPATNQESERKDPQQIEGEIEETREELGETVAALAGKADVKDQVRQRISSAREAAAGAAESVMAKAQALAEESQDSPSAGSTAATAAAARARENPLPAVAAGGFLAGIVVGRFLGRG
jgi:hypothetical protein